MVGHKVQGVQSVEVGMQLIEVLIRSGTPLSLSNLAERSSMTMPKAHRYLASFIRTGLITQDPATSRYDLGPLALQLGLAALGRIDQSALGQRYLRELTEDLGETSCLCVWANQGVTIASVQAATQSIFMGVRIGSVLSLTRSASGLIYLSHLPTTLTKPFISQQRTECNQTALDKLIKQVREEGVARIRDTMLPGISAVAAPVFNHESQLVYALTVLGSSANFDTNLEGMNSKRVKEAAAQLSRELGAPAQHPSKQ